VTDAEEHATRGDREPAAAHLLRTVDRVLCLAWLFRVTAFAPGESRLDAAAIVSVPGAVVAGLVGTFYAGVLVLAF